jgi:hypothetical protein
MKWIIAAAVLGLCLTVSTANADWRSDALADMEASAKGVKEHPMTKEQIEAGRKWIDQQVAKSEARRQQSWWYSHHYWYEWYWY